MPKLSETAEKMRKQEGNEDEAAIFDAHTELAQDPELADGVAESVKNLESPESAVLVVGEEYAQMFVSLWRTNTWLPAPMTCATSPAR